MVNKLHIDRGSEFSLTFLEHFVMFEDEVTVQRTAIEQAYEDACRLDLPFDITNTADPNPFIFGALGEGPLLGEWVRYRGGPVKSLDGQVFETREEIGNVVGHFGGRVVIAFDCDTYGFLYLGWVSPEDFEIVQIHIPENSTRWMH